MMKLKVYFLYACLAILFGIVSCNQGLNNTTENNTDKFTSGTYSFVFDESLYPLLDQEIYVFKSIFTGAKPEVSYMPENKILDLILNNKARFAIMGRTLNADETKILNNRNLPPKINKLAVDGIALIVAKKSPDSLMLLSEVKNLFKNNTKSTKNLVFDSPNSSVLNFLKSISETEQKDIKNIYALKNSKEVIKYVAEHQNSIGFISYSWLTEPDADYVDATKKVTVVSIKDDHAKDVQNAYFKPAQSTLALKQYPLSRSVYIVDCTGRVGLGLGFAAFLQSERGQKIVLRAGLLPDSMPRRDVNIKTEL